MKNLLFIPCYRCEKQIIRVLSKLENYSQYFTEILVIDNISPDQTAEAAHKYVSTHPTLSRNVKVVRNPENIGLGGSHKLAFQYAIEEQFNHVVILHGDDQGDLKDFIPVLKDIQLSEMDQFQMGARFHFESKIIGYSKFRIFGNLVYNLAASLITLRPIYDLGGSGVNLFPVKRLKEHPFKNYANDLTFHVFLLLNALRLKQPIRFIPVSWREDDQISNVKLFKQAKKLAMILISYLIIRKKLLQESNPPLSHTYSEWVVY